VALKRDNLREQANRVLRARIIGGELAPGQVYSANALAESLGVSATPVREALLDLAKDHLVIPVPNRGFRVIEPTDDDLEEIFALRLLLEVPPLADVIAVATDAELEALDEHVEACAAAAEAADVADFLIADRSFHLGLTDLAGNRRLTNLVAGLRDQTHLLGIKSLASSGKLGQAAQEHREVVDAVKSRDEELAKTLMARHLGHTRGIWAGRSKRVDDAGTAYDASPS
jgi:DNA-binding GntR family transcriptional regulator